MTAIAIERKAEVLQHLSNGKRLSDIAPLLGVGVTAISNALKDDKEYRDALHVGFSRRIDMAEDAISEAREQVDVSRARAYWGAMAWRAEREFPDRWGTKPLQVNIGAAVIMDAGAAGAIGELLQAAASRQGVSLGVSGETIDNDNESNQYVK